MKLKDKLRDSKRIQKLKEYKESYDNLMSNPRINAGIRLSIWFVIILIISLIVNLGGKKDYVEPKEVKFSNTSVGVKEYFSNIKSYEANVKLYKGEVVNSYFVTCVDRCIISFDGNKYSDLTDIDDVDLDRVFKFNVNNISKLISNVDEDYFTNFKDGSYSVLYSVLANEFFIDISSDNYISVKFSGNNGVNSVEFDFSNLQDTEFYDKVVIEYSNVNNIFSVEDL